MLKHLFCLLTVCYTAISFGQVTLGSYSGSGSLTGCDTSDPFQFNVNNLQTLNPLDTVFFSFPFPTGVQLETFSILSGGAGVVGFTENSAYLTGLTSVSQITIQYQLSLNCSVGNLGSFSFPRQVSYDLNHGAISVFPASSPQPILATPSSLVFVGGTNLDYNSAQFNLPITRTYVFRNSLSLPFTGTMSFRDTTEFNQNATGFRLDTAYISYGNAVEISHLFNDSTAVLNLSLNGLAQTDSIVITEIGYLIACQTSAIENSRTRFAATFGCSPSDACTQVSYYEPNQAVAHFDPNDKPIADFIPDHDFEVCIDAPTHLRHVVKNIGAGAANAGRLEFNMPFAQPQTLNTTHYYLDSLVLSSIQVSVGGQLVPAASIIYFQGSGNGVRYIHVNANVPAGDSMVFEYDVVFNCVQPNEYDDYFNHQAYLHPLHHPLLGWLYHPCAAASSEYGNGLYNHLQGLEQSFTSLVGQMNDGTSSWFEVDNASPLILGNLLQVNDPILVPQGVTYTVPYDLDNALIEIHLQLENGLLFPDLDSLFMSSQNGATTTTLTPVSVVVIPGTGIGTGDEVVAQFQLPPTWSIPYSFQGHDFTIVTAEFLQFFNSFKVHFKLEADCSVAPSNGVVHVLQEFFINPTPSCSDCKLPLSQVGTLTNINCPGCVMPGWNLTSFSLERQNIGTADVDNNHLPDGYAQAPANPAAINLSAAMIGDTLRGSIKAFVSDGQDFDVNGNPVGFTFASAGFEYDEGMLEFSLDVVSDLKFIGGTGNITIGGIAHPFNVLASDAEVATNGNIGIPMSVTALNGYGVPAFTVYDATVTDFEFYPEFRVVNNLNNATVGGNPYYDARFMNCFLHMGGSPFTVEGLSLGTYADATTPSNTAFLVASSGAVREGNYKYWCTSYEGRFLGVGLDLKTRISSVGENVYPYGSLCLKGFTYQYMVSTGKAAYEPALAPNQNSANIFHHEIRAISTMDSLTLHFPQEYEPQVINFHNHNVAFDPNNNVHTWSQVPRDYPLSDAVIGNDFVTIFPSQFIDQITAFPPNPTPYHFANEENQVYTISLYLAPKDCSNLPELIPYSNNTFDVSFSNYPLALDTQDTTFSVPITISGLNNSLNFRNPNPELILTEEGNGVNASGVNYWDVSLTTEAIVDPNTYDQAIMHSAENVFVTFASPSGNFSNINLATVTTFTGPNPSSGPATQIPQWADPSTAYVPYALNYIGHNVFANQLISKKFRINADFDCSNLPAGSIDSIYVIKGWNCLNYPSTLAEACFVDTAVLYYVVPQTALEVSVIHEDTVSTCAITEVSLVFGQTLGQTDSISVTLFDSPIQSYSYVAGSGHVINSSGTTYIEPVSTGNALHWDLDGLSSIFSDSVVFTYQLQTSCGFEADSVNMNIQAFNYCGLQFTNIDDNWTPAIISNLPERDTLTLLIDPLVVNQCGEQVTLSVVVTNEGTSPTGGLNTIDWAIPFGFSYVGNHPFVSESNDTLTFAIQENIDANDSYTFLVDLNTVSELPCDTLTTEFSLNYAQAYICGLDTCVTAYSEPAVTSSSIVVSLPLIQISNIDSTDLCAGINSITFDILASDTTSGAITVIDLASNMVIGSTAVSVSTTSQTTTVFLSAFSDSLALVYDGCACEDTMYYSFECSTLCVADASFTVSNTCIGDTIIAVPDEAGGTHQWAYSYFNITSNAETALFPAATVGTYTITHIYTNLCGDSDTSVQQVQVSYPIFTSIVLQGASPFCEGDSVEVTVMNSGNYEFFDWSTGDTTSTIWVDSAGVYQVFVTDTNGCVSYCPSISLSTVDTPEPINDTLYLCSVNGTLTLDAGSADTYLWSNGSTSQTLIVTSPGIYTVEACNTSITACCVMDTFTVLLENFTFDIPDTMICSNSPTIVNSPMASSEYLWSTGSTNSSALITQNGTHWLTLLSANGCYYTDSFEVSFYPSVDAGFVFADTICTTDTLSCFYPNDTNSLSEHHWIFEVNGFDIHSYEETPCMQFPTSGVVGVTHIISNACSADTAFLEITVLEPIENGCITIIGQNPFCEGDSVLLTTSGSYASIEWMDEFGNVLGTEDTLVVYSGGVYSANAVDVNGCVSTCICTALQTLALDSIDFQSTTLCATNPSITFTLPNGIGNWSTGTYGASETFTEAGNYYVDVTTDNGCTYSDNFSIYLSSPLAPIEFENLGGCMFRFFSIPQQPNCTYVWTLPNGQVIGTTNDFIHNHAGYGPPQASWVTLTVTDTLLDCTTQSDIFVKWKGCNNLQNGMYPNPFTDQLTIEYNFQDAERIDLVLYDVLGKEVYRKGLSVTDTEVTIDLSQLANDTYTIKLFVDDNIEFHEKVVKN